MTHDPGAALPQCTGTAANLPWHTLTVNAVSAHFDVDAMGGLSAGTAAERARRYGPNALREAAARSPWRMLLDQFADFMIVVLIVAAIVSGVIGDVKDTLAIVVIVLLNAVIGFVQEFRAERAMAALRKMTASTAHVVRDGEVGTIAGTDVVPGDVVLLEAGNIVPADLRLIDAARLLIDEALLTGESVAAEKGCAPLAHADLPLGDRRNIAYKGTIVAHGRARGIAVATGMATELGRIATLLDEGVAPRTPLQQRLAVFGRRLGIAVIAICVLVFAVGLLRGEAPLLLFLTAISLVVAAIPEALPAVVTISLALGAGKMARQHALIRRLPAVETLGSVTSICSDKTGTLTTNRMRVVEVYAAPGASRDWKAAAAVEPWRTLFAALALSNDAARNRQGHMTGDPTEVALYRAAQDAGFDKAVLEAAAPRLLDLPFDSERKRMTTIHQDGDRAIAYVKGAPENVLPLCTALLAAEGELPLPLAAVHDAAERMAAEGLRVLAVARRMLPAPPSETEAAAVESGLVFVGLVGLIDPPRAEAKAAVALCASAGITARMITGDHPATALAIARELGIAADRTQMMAGPELAQLSDEALALRVADVRVYARVDPAQKIRIVLALQRHGEIVAMTGDGVNDAPALKCADIGVAMGKGGTDVAREASSLVLLDDNFATIVEAVREGRRIYDNILKFIRFSMTGNSGVLCAIVLAPFLGLPISLLPIQILWINLALDGLPGLALAAEPAEHGIMRRPPRPPQESIFAHGMWQRIAWAGLLIASLSLLAQAWALHQRVPNWQTMVFTVLTLGRLALAMAIRSERESLFTQGVTSNLPLLAAVAFTVALQLAAIYVPFLNAVLDTAPLAAAELALCFALAGIVFVAVEIEKLLVRRGWLYADPASAKARS